MVQASTYSKAILFTCSVGIALSVYAFVVEERKSQDAKYQAACDLNERMSCSRVLTSQYAKGFGLVRHVLGEDSPLNVPNSIPGGAAFALFAVLCLLQKSWTAKVQIGLGIVSNIASVYLGAILYFVLQDFCILCVSVYVINFVNLVLAYLRLRALTPKQAGKQRGQQKSQKGPKKQQNEKQKSPQAEKKKQQPQQEKPKSPQVEKQKQNQQNGKVKNQQNDKQKSPKTPNSKKKN